MEKGRENIISNVIVVYLEFFILFHPWEDRKIRGKYKKRWRI